MTLKNKNNYMAFCNALLTITMLSNEFNNELEEDASLIIELFAKAFDVKEDDANYMKKIICDDLTIISTSVDAEAFSSNRGEQEYPEVSNYLYIKGDIINKIGIIANQFNNSYQQRYFNYHYLRPYYRENRFNELQESATRGNVDINRTAAIMLALGIGCEQNKESALYRLKQCALWGDVVSLYLLASLSNDEKEVKLYSSLAGFSHYFMEGRTIVPSKEKCDEEVKDMFALIASIRQDIVLSLGEVNINYSFVEVLLMDKLDYYQKMASINRYREGIWKEVSNSSFNPNKKLGFKVEGDK